MRKIIVKKNDKKISLEIEGIFINGFIVSSTMCKQTRNELEYNINDRTTAYHKEK